MKQIQLRLDEEHETMLAEVQRTTFIDLQAIMLKSLLLKHSAIKTPIERREALPRGGSKVISVRVYDDQLVRINKWKRDNDATFDALAAKVVELEYQKVLETK